MIDDNYEKLEDDSTSMEPPRNGRRKVNIVDDDGFYIEDEAGIDVDIDVGCSKWENEGDK